MHAVSMARVVRLEQHRGGSSALVAVYLLFHNVFFQRVLGGTGESLRALLSSCTYIGQIEEAQRLTANFSTRLGPYVRPLFQ
jgi:hypothetical protein